MSSFNPELPHFREHSAILPFYFSLQIPIFSTCSSNICSLNIWIFFFFLACSKLLSVLYLEIVPHIAQRPRHLGWSPACKAITLTPIYTFTISGLWSKFITSIMKNMLTSIFFFFFREGNHSWRCSDQTRDQTRVNKAEALLSVLSLHYPTPTTSYLQLKFLLMVPDAQSSHSYRRI